MSKVFSAKRNFVEFEYEFLDGTTAKFKYYEPVQKDIEEDIDFNESTDKLREKLEHRKELFKRQLKSDKDGLIDKLLDEQYEHGNLYDLIQALDDMLSNTKKKK